MRSTAGDRTSPASLAQGRRGPARSRLSPALARVLALQSLAGNAAVTHLCQPAPVAPNTLRQTDGGTTSATVQRAPTEDSNQILRDLYVDMTQRSPTFEELDRLVTAEKGIRLVDGHWKGSPLYRADTHSIYIPVTPPVSDDGRRGRSARRRPESRPLDDLRTELLFEMHNALQVGAHTRNTELLAGDLPDDASATDKLLAPYRAAAFALASEWVEWSMIPEINVRTERINSEVGGTEVKSMFGRRFDTPDEKWFRFRNYLEEQVRNGHTQGKDPAADSPEWVGYKILDLVLSESPGSLQIAQSEVADFISGQRRSIKDEGENPFRSESIVQRAAGLA